MPDAPSGGVARGELRLRHVLPGHRQIHDHAEDDGAVFFWITKVLCTTVGETAADLLNEKAGLGLAGVSVLMSALLAVVLVGAVAVTGQALPWHLDDRQEGVRGRSSV